MAKYRAEVYDTLDEFVAAIGETETGDAIHPIPLPYKGYHRFKNDYKYLVVHTKRTERRTERDSFSQPVALLKFDGVLNFTGDHLHRFDGARDIAIHSLTLTEVAVW
jgi:hypothetical protein